MTHKHSKCQSTNIGNTTVSDSELKYRRKER